MAHQLTDKEKFRLRVLRMRDDGHNYETIARKLKVDAKKVKIILNRIRDVGNVKDRPRSGRPKKLNEGDRRRLVKEVKGHERRSTRKTAATFKSTISGRVSKSTIHRNLKAEGLIAHRKKRRPKLSEAQKGKRVKFATKYRRKDWSQTAFWDEKIFELSHPSNPKDDIVWDQKGAEYFKEEVKFPQSIMVGVAITDKGPSRLVIYEDTVNAQTFIDNIDGPIADINRMYEGQEWEWIMDKATCHTAKVTQAYMTENVPILFPSKDWPANSPDLSAIENMFGNIQDIVDQKNPKDIKALRRIVKAEFKKLTAEKCKKFISALPRRLKRIIDSKGEYCY